jgi:hypothetical protein
MRRISMAIVLALAVTSWAAERAPTGTIVGTVVDANDKPIVGCIVTAQEDSKLVRRVFQNTTNDKGMFKIENVPEGAYNLNARTVGARGKAYKSAKVKGGETTDVGMLKMKSK